MSFNNAFHRMAPQPRARKRSGIEQHFADVCSQLIAVPNAEMAELVTSEKEPLEVKRRKGVIDIRQPLRHSVVVGILCLEREFQHASTDARSPPIRGAQSTVGRKAAQNRVSVCD